MKIKKLTILSACLFIAMKCLGQNNPEKPFTLQGAMSSPRLDSVSIEYIDGQGKYIHQVVPAADGKFTISGTISQPSFSFLLFKHKGEILSKRDVEIKRNLVYIEPGNMVINKEADVQGYVYVKGSKTQDEWNELKGKTQALQATVDSLSELNPASHGVGNRSVLAPYQAKIADIYYKYFLSHPNSDVSSDRVMYFTGAFSLDSLKTIYRNFSPAIKESTGARRLAAVIKSREVGIPGTEAFQFTVKNREGKDLDLANFKGKYVLLDFWATWCIPCRASMPHIISLYQKYKTKNFDIIAIGDDDKNVTNWSAAIDKDGTGMFHQTLRGANMEMARKGTPNPRDLGEQYGVRSLPTKILVDPSGKIIGRFDDGSDDDLDKMLTTIFKL
ncbi:MAG: Thiol-disulfide isomerase or thioredoxin [Mucilaginibacter sp.]|nr:Thiol-disulfide isomerase or thioredoxin [Mucilaginibacter sp.]